MAFPLIELLRKRSASRALSGEKLEEEILDRLMNAAQLTASCYNNQPWRFLFMYSEDALEKGRKALTQGNGWARRAPLLIAGFSKADLDCQPKDGRKYYLFDLGMAVQSILLQATEEGLVARPMAGYSPDVIMREFNLPDDYEVYVMIAVGREGNVDDLDERLQKVSRAPRKRNPLSSNFFLNAFKEDVPRES